MSTAAPTIAVIGLGYVGLPLAVALAEHFPTAGLDIDAQRIAELREGHDRTGEIGGEPGQEALPRRGPQSVHIHAGHGQHRGRIPPGRSIG